MSDQLVQLVQLVIRVKQLVQLLALSRSTIYGKMNEGSPQYDASFPLPIQLGAASVGWRLSDVENWIDAQAQKASDRRHQPLPVPTPATKKRTPLSCSKPGEE